MSAHARVFPAGGIGRLRLAGAALLLALAGCGQLAPQPLPESQRGLVGEWRSRNSVLRIEARGVASYERREGAGRFSVEGNIHSFDAGGFSIGIGPLSRRFELQQPPRLSQGRMSIVVDGEVLSRAADARERQPRRGPPVI
jgi:hypothetical protein